MIEIIFILTDILDDSQKHIDNIILNMKECFNDSFTNKFLKNTNNKPEYANLIKRKLNAIKQIIDEVNSTHQDFIKNLNRLTSGNAICNQNQQPPLNSDYHFNGHSVNRNFVRSTKNVTTNCTDLSQDNQLLNLFKKLMFSTSFFKEDDSSQFNRYSTVNYYDLNTYAQFQYPFSTFADGLPNESPEIQIDKLSGDFYGDEIILMFPCKQDKVDQQQIYHLNSRIQTEQVYDFNSSTIVYNETVLSKQISQLSTKMPKTAICFTNNSYYSFAESFIPKYDAEEGIRRFIDKESSLTSTLINITSIFEILDQIIQQKQQSAKKRIYNFNEPLVFQQYNKSFNRQIKVKQKPLQIIIQDMDIMQVKTQVDTIIKKYLNVNSSVLQQYNIILCFTMINESQKLKFPLSLYFKRLQTNNYFFNVTTFAREFQSYSFQNSLYQDFVVKSQVKDVFQQNVIQICSQVKNGDNVHYGIVCNNIPLEQLFYTSYLSDELNNFYLINKATESLVFQTNRDKNIDYDYKYFISKFQDQQILHLYTNVLSYMEFDNNMYYSGQIAGIYQLIVEIPKQAHNNQLRLNLDIDNINDLTYNFSTNTVDKNIICYNNINIQSTKCSYYIQFPQNTVTSTTLTAQQSKYHSGFEPQPDIQNLVDNAINQTRNDSRSVAEKVDFMNILLASSKLQFNILTQTASDIISLKALETQKDSRIQAGKLYRNGILSLYPFMNNTQESLQLLKNILTQYFISEETDQYDIQQFKCNYQLENVYEEFVCNLFAKKHKDSLNVDFVIIPQPESKEIFFNPATDTDKLQLSALQTLNSVKSRINSTRQRQRQLAFNDGLLYCSVYENMSALYQGLRTSKQLLQLKAQEKIITNSYSIIKLKYLRAIIYKEVDFADEVKIEIDCADAPFPNNIMKSNQNKATSYNNVFYTFSYTASESKDSNWCFLWVLLALLGTMCLILIIIQLFKI